MSKCSMYHDALPSHQVIHDALARAVATTLDADFDLIALSAHEQAIAHRIAVYLEPLFPGFQTDCEYNKRGRAIKTRCAVASAYGTRMRPDIIVHRRGRAVNVLAIELKARGLPASPGDRNKLAELTVGGRYSYKGAAFVCIRNSRKQIENGVLGASIDWLDCPFCKSTSAQTVEVTCRNHLMEVRTISIGSAPRSTADR